MTLRRLTDPVRSVIFNLVFYSTSVMYFLLVSPVVLIPGHKAIRAVIMGYCLMSLFWARWLMGIRFQWRGGEHLPPRGSAVLLAATHQSYADPMLAYILRQDLTALAKKELFNTPLIGPLLSKMRVIEVDRQKGSASEDLDQVVGRVHAEGLMLIVYPQATRVRPGERRRLKSGAFYLQDGRALPVCTAASNSGALWSRGFWHHSGLCVFEIVRQLPTDLDKQAFMTALEEDLVLKSEALIRETGFEEQIAQTQRLTTR